MSGPKISMYTITAEQRRVLKEQRLLDERRAIADQKIKKAQEKLSLITKEFDREKAIAAELVKENGDDGNINRLIDNLKGLELEVQSSLKHVEYGDLDALEAVASSTALQIMELEKISTEIVEQSNKNEFRLKMNLYNDIDGGFSTSFEDVREEVEKRSISDLYDQINRKLLRFKELSFLPRSYGQEISEILKKLDSINSEVFLKNYIAITVNPIIKKIELFISEYNECSEEFDALILEYNALCDLYNYESQNYICSFESIKILKSEIQRIKGKVLQERERTYISKMIDEVMTEMGYSILGSREVNRKNGEYIHSELYEYGEGTAVNVTHSADGKIVMELGGVDIDDRTPTVKESEKLCYLMEEFCNDFEKIEKRLLAKGVVLKERVSLLPPSVEFSQIINTKDYHMRREAERFNAVGQRRLRNDQKTMKKE